MAYPYGNYNPYGGMQMPMTQPMPYGQPAPDQLSQLRMQQGQQMPPQAQQPMPMQPPSAMIWVQGEAAAKAYMVAPGSRVTLWDSEANVIYIKSVDGNGIPSTKILDYTERAETPQMPAGGRRRGGGDYVTRAEFDVLAAKLAELTTTQTKGVDQNAESAV